jgi:AAA domain
VHQPILVCTYTNTAVDNLVEGLVKAGLQPLRIGPDGKVRESLLPFSLKGRLKTHPLRLNFLELERRANEQRKKLRAICRGRKLNKLQECTEDWKKYCERSFLGLGGSLSDLA